MSKLWIIERPSSTSRGTEGVMTPAERQAIKREICEYLSIIEWASQCGRLETLKRAHLTPIVREEALRLIGEVKPLPVDLLVVFRGRRGRARFLGGLRYRIALPAGEPGPGFSHLRVGIVLHELAHVIDHWRRNNRETKPRMNHSVGFKVHFGELLARWEKSQS